MGVNGGRAEYKPWELLLKHRIAVIYSQYKFTYMLNEFSCMRVFCFLFHMILILTIKTRESSYDHNIRNSQASARRTAYSAPSLHICAHVIHPFTHKHTRDMYLFNIIPFNINFIDNGFLLLFERKHSGARKNKNIPSEYKICTRA